MKNILERIAHLSKKEKQRVIGSALGALVTVLAFTFGNTHAPAVSSYLTAVPALLGIAVTCLARVNDIRPEHKGLIWNARRVSLTVVGATCIAYLYAPFSAAPTYPSWLATAMIWGVFITQVTTPMMPPWHKIITGEVKAFPFKKRKQ